MNALRRDAFLRPSSPDRLPEMVSDFDLDTDGLAFGYGTRLFRGVWIQE